MSKLYARGVVESLQPTQLRTYLALVEAVSLLQYAVRGQLRSAGGLSYVQFEILAVLSAPAQPLTMTDLADVVVYSRSGLTHQAGLLEQAELIARHTSPEDQRSRSSPLPTPAGRASRRSRATSTSSTQCCSNHWPRRGRPR